MCGIFGIIAPKTFSSKDKKLKKLVYYSQQRGKDASGFITFNQEKSYQIYKADHCLSNYTKF